MARELTSVTTMVPVNVCGVTNRPLRVGHDGVKSITEVDLGTHRKVLVVRDAGKGNKRGWIDGNNLAAMEYAEGQDPVEDPPYVVRMRDIPVDANAVPDANRVEPGVLGAIAAANGATPSDQIAEAATKAQEALAAAQEKPKRKRKEAQQA